MKQFVPDYQYSYFSGAIIFLTAWLILFLWQRRYHAEMLSGTLLSTPFAFTAFLFIPQYWTPPSLWNLDARYGIGVEDFLWSAAVGGIASVASEIFFRGQLVRSRVAQPDPRWAPLIVVVVVLAVLVSLFRNHVMYDTIAALLVGAATVAVLRPDLIGRMTRGALIFAVIYGLLFAYFLLLYPEFVTRFYNIKNLLGFYVLGIPIEELLFAYSGGLMWCVIYEYMQHYRAKSNPSGPAAVAAS